MVLFGVDTTKTAPSNALLLVDEVNKIYYAPLFFQDNGIITPAKLKVVRKADIRGKNYRPDEKCRDQGYFIQDGGALFWSLLKDFKIIPRKSRWNADGTWNW